MERIHNLRFAWSRRISPDNMPTICVSENLKTSMSQAREVEMGKDRNKL